MIFSFILFIFHRTVFIITAVFTTTYFFLPFSFFIILVKSSFFFYSLICLSKTLIDSKLFSENSLEILIKAPLNSFCCFWEYKFFFRRRLVIIKFIQVLWILFAIFHKFLHQSLFKYCLEYLFNLGMHHFHCFFFIIQ